MSLEVITMARGRPYKCPYCNGHNTWKKGKRSNKCGGVKMIRYCKDCDRKFTPKNQRSDL